VPNRRRRKLSTAMSAVAALAVASPIAVVAVSELSVDTKPAPQHREFVQAAMITDLPNELMSALSQGLSQFGINVPPMPTGLLTGSGATSSPVLTTPGLATTGLTAPPGLATQGLTTPGVGVPPVTAAAPALTDPLSANPALSNPALTSPTGAIPTGAIPTGAVPGLTTPPIGADSALTTPISTATGLPGANEVPISAPIGLDSAAGSYPILGGDPSLGATPLGATSLGATPLGATPSSGGGGLFGDLSSAASQLGAGQAIDLLKGMVMPAIMSAMKPGALPAAPALPAPPVVP
jgi:hypothetical protein